MPLRCLFLFLMLSPPVSVVAGAGERIEGPVLADVLDVIDGDSLRVLAHVWPGQRVEVSVRLRGLDAPELRSRCPRESRMALAARSALVRRLGHEERQVLLGNVSGDKYFGRVLADVILKDGSDLARFMLDNAPVRPYGGGRREPWCLSPDDDRSIDGWLPAGTQPAG